MSSNNRRKRQKQAERENIEQNSQILNLPDETLLLIFKFLTTEQLTIVTQVCRKLRQIALDDELWRTIDLTKNSFSNRNLLKFFQRFPRASCETLKICGTPILTRNRSRIFRPTTFTEKMATAIRSSYPNLRYFHLSRFDFREKSNAVKKIFYFPPNLDGIFLNQCEMLMTTSDTENGFLKLDHQQIKETNPKFSTQQISRFSFENSSCLTLTSLVLLPILCPNLVELNLNGCHRIPNSSNFTDVLLKFHRTMRRLFLSQTKIDDDTIHSICRKLKRLNLLDIRLCSNVTTDIVENLLTLKQLRILRADPPIENSYHDRQFR